MKLLALVVGAGGQLGEASAVEVPGHAMLVLRGSRGGRRSPAGAG